MTDAQETMSKMISVIVPVYGVEAYLDRCVKSLLSQTYTDLEIILIDDGSPDRCGEMCDCWAALDSRIKAVHQKNAGQAGARNAGLEICKGEYVCFVDSDDDIDPQMIGILYKAIHDGNFDLAICGHRRIKEAGQLPPFQGKIAEAKALNSSELWQEVFGRLNNAVWNKLYRQDLIGSLRFPQGLIHGEDYIFNIQYIVRCKSAGMIEAPLYHYYVRPGSITGSGFHESKFDEIKAKDMALTLVQQYQPVQLENARKYCFRARMNVLRSLYRSGREKDYSGQVLEYREYTKKHYAQVAPSIRMKERVEYHLFQSAEPVYAWITRKQRQF